MLSSAILFVPAWRLIGPLNVNPLFSLDPKADPEIIDYITGLPFGVATGSDKKY